MFGNMGWSIRPLSPAKECLLNSSIDPYGKHILPERQPISIFQEFPRPPQKKIKNPWRLMVGRWKKFPIKKWSLFRGSIRSFSGLADLVDFGISPKLQGASLPWRQPLPDWRWCVTRWIPRRKNGGQRWIGESGGLQPLFWEAKQNHGPSEIAVFFCLEILPWKKRSEWRPEAILNI